MNAPTRPVLATWRTDDVVQAASDLDEVRNSFHDTVALARNAPDRADSSWAGHAADACRERVAEEAESARKFAFELEDVADTLRTVGRRLEFAKVAAENAAVDIENDPHGLVVHDDWAVNISPMALIPTSETNSEKVRQAMIERQEQMDAAVRFLVDEDAACAQLVTEAMTRAANAGRRLDQAAAFERATGRSPETPADWLTASMLDPTSEAEKNQGVEATVVMGRIRPVPGQGVVTMDLYIPAYSVFNSPTDYDLGDSRGPTSDAEVGNARVELIVDYESGVVVARQNPSISENGKVEVGTPDIRVQQLTNGDVSIAYDAGNPLALNEGRPTHRVRGDIAISTEDGQLVIGGSRSNYPAFEAYHHANDGAVTTLVTDQAADPLGLAQFGPLVGLPFSHTLGDPSLLRPFEDVAPIADTVITTRPGSTALGKDTDDVVVTPIEPTR